MIFKASNILCVDSANVFVRPVLSVQRCDHNFSCCAYTLLALGQEKLVNSKIRRAEAWNFNDFKVSCNDTGPFSSYNKCKKICMANPCHYKYLSTCII